MVFGIAKMSLFARLQKQTYEGTRGYAESLVVRPDEILSLKVDSPKVEKYFALIAQELDKCSQDGKNNFTLSIFELYMPGNPHCIPTHSQHVQRFDPFKNKHVTHVHKLSPPGYWEWFQKVSGGKDSNIWQKAEEARLLRATRHRNFSEDVVQHFCFLWNNTPENKGVICTRHTEVGYKGKLHVGLRWDWQQKDSSGVDLLRKNVEKRYREWVSAREDLEREIKRSATE